MQRKDGRSHAAYERALATARKKMRRPKATEGGSGAKGARRERRPTATSMPAGRAMAGHPAGAEAPSQTLQEELEALGRRRIREALEKCEGNQTKAAEMLGMPRRTFIKRLDAYGIARPRKK